MNPTTWKPKRTASEARAVVALRRAEATRIGHDPGREWAEAEYQKHQQHARVITRNRPANRPQPKPASTTQPRQLREDLLAVCRGGCPDYVPGNGMGGSEMCQLDYAGCSGCRGKAKGMFVQRVYGERESCERQRKAVGISSTMSDA